MENTLVATEPAAAEPSARGRWFVIAGLLFVMLLAVACASDGSPAETVFSDMVKAAEDVQSARAEVTVEMIGPEDGGGEATVSLSGTVDYERPDRARFTARVSALSPASSGGGEIAVMAIGSDVYLKPPMSDEWVKFAIPFDIGMNADANPLKALTDLRPGDLGDLSLLERETVDGVLTDHLRFTTDEQGLLGLLGTVAAAGGMPSVDEPDMPEGVDAEFQLDAWIGVEDHLPRREVISGRFAGPDETTGVEYEARLNATITFSRYGEDLAIEAPDNVATR